MSGLAIEIRGLHKAYRGLRSTPTVAVDNLDLDVPLGGVHGFLGPNGAGKTTTIRCLLGLVAPSAGTLSVFGHDATTDLQAVISRIGALVESPKFFPAFTGRRNLELVGAVAGISGSEIDRVLEEVGLADRGHDRFGEYSLGMKQRLAVAGALLKQPDLLILDEPANGLDPAGIKEIRELIRRYGATGATVFVSSHQLAEVQLMCDTVAIINRGRLVTMGPVREVVSGRGGRLVVTIDDAAGATSVLESAGFAATVGTTADTVEVEVAEERAAEVTRTLAAEGRYLRGLRAESASLESVFLELTAEPAPILPSSGEPS